MNESSGGEGGGRRAGDSLPVDPVARRRVVWLDGVAGLPCVFQNNDICLMKLGSE